MTNSPPPFTKRDLFLGCGLIILICGSFIYGLCRLFHLEVFWAINVLVVVLAMLIGWAQRANSRALSLIICGIISYAFVVTVGVSNINEQWASKYNEKHQVPISQYTSCITRPPQSINRALGNLWHEIMGGDAEAAQYRQELRYEDNVPYYQRKKLDKAVAYYWREYGFKQGWSAVMMGKTSETAWDKPAMPAVMTDGNRPSPVVPSFADRARSDMNSVSLPLFAQGAAEAQAHIGFCEGMRVTLRELEHLRNGSFKEMPPRPKVDIGSDRDCLQLMNLCLGIVDVDPMARHWIHALSSVLPDLLNSGSHGSMTLDALSCRLEYLHMRADIILLEDCIYTNCNRVEPVVDIIPLNWSSAGTNSTLSAGGRDICDIDCEIAETIRSMKTPLTYVRRTVPRLKLTANWAIRGGETRDDPQGVHDPLRKLVLSSGNYVIEVFGTLECDGRRISAPFTPETIMSLCGCTPPQTAKRSMTISVYEPTISSEQRNSITNLVFADGSVYEGEFVNGKCHGQGSMKMADGETYSGAWVDGKRSGRGEITWANGVRYTGAWVDDNRTGYGTYFWPNGDKYTGEFVEGKFNGNGTLSLASGGTYSGAWVDGERTGQGTYRWPNGDKYTGSFVKGTLDGRGTLSANGQVQTGVWKNDKMLGEIELNHLIWTMLTNATGRTYVNCTVTRIDPVGISLSSS